MTTYVKFGLIKIPILQECYKLVTIQRLYRKSLIFVYLSIYLTLSSSLTDLHHRNRGFQQKKNFKQFLLYKNTNDNWKRANLVGTIEKQVIKQSITIDPTVNARREF